MYDTNPTQIVQNAAGIHPQRLAMLDNSVNLAANEHFNARNIAPSFQSQEFSTQSYFYDSIGAEQQVLPVTSTTASPEANNLRAQLEELARENKALKAKNKQLENDFKIVSDTYMAVEAQLEDVLDAKIKAEERNEQNQLATMAFAKENRKSNARICSLQEKLDAQPRLAKENERLRSELMDAKERLSTMQMLVDQQAYILEGGEEIMEDVV